VIQPPVERADVTALDLGLATELAAVLMAAREHVAVAAVTGESYLLETRESDEPPDARWLVRDTGGSLLGFAEMHLPQHEYTDATILIGAVHPDAQRQGIGAALLVAVTAATDRPVLRARAWRGTAGAAALPALGFRRTHTHGIRRLDLTDPSVASPALRAEAAAAVERFDLVRRLGPTPEADLDEMQVLREAINDAPDAHEWEPYPPERIAAYEQSLVRRRQTQHTIVARDRATGEPAGLTMTCVKELAPEVAAQEDTSVLPPFRGLGLGLLLKVEMAAWLREERPDVHAVDTWNDTTNAPMLAVNERLGTRIVAESSAYRRART
jgi:GNAT superfamily N-acetyltransferase